MRAFSNAVLTFCFNLSGPGLGPLLTGFASDMLARNPAIADQSLRYALSLALLPSSLSALFFLYTARFFGPAPISQTT
jgi:hypothetical protein